MSSRKDDKDVVTIPARISREVAEAAKQVGVRINDVKGVGLLITKLEQESAALKGHTMAIAQQRDEMSTKAETAEKAREDVATQLSVVLAERKLLDDKLLRVEREASVLRVERDALQDKLNKAELRERSREERYIALVDARTAMEVKHAEEMLETHRVKDEELKAATTNLREQSEALQAALDAEREQRASLQERLAVATAERSLLDEMAGRRSTEDEALKVQLARSEARATEALASKAVAEQEGERLQRELATANTEKLLLQQVGNRMRQHEQDVAATVRSAREAAEVSLREQLEAAEAEARSSKERLGALETEQAVADVRHATMSGQLNLLQRDYALLAAEKKQLEELKLRNFLHARAEPELLVPLVPLSPSHGRPASPTYRRVSPGSPPHQSGGAYSPP